MTRTRAAHAERDAGAGTVRGPLAAAMLLAASTPALAGLDFTLHKQGRDPAGNTLLVIGGIQGDEPGGFNAASLLVTHYRLRRGNVWVVPNLAFESIVKRTRGVHGDLNRKFPAVAATDPDYERLEKIKRIITDPQVDYVFNLHDGSGFFRPAHVDAQRNPRRWGQSIIIDQERVDLPRFGEVGDLARRIAARVNRGLRDADHSFHVKNTRTRDGDVEMAKTLTYFAINNAKPAVGLEASKALRTHLRVYYHLLLIESYMEALGIDFERGFELTPSVVKETVDNNVKVSFYDNRMFFDMVGVRRRLGYVPLRKNASIEFTASSPLVAIMSAGKTYRVSYGNRRVTELHPQPFEYDLSIGAVGMRLDGTRRAVAFGTVVEVRDAFAVEPMPGYRVNVIGFRRAGARDESGLIIGRGDVASRFSVDRSGHVYRVEVYRGAKFTGMVLVRFVSAPGGRERASRGEGPHRDSALERSGAGHATGAAPSAAG